MKWRDLKQYLAECTEEQLDKDVIALIDDLPWKPDCFQIAKDDDPELPNNPYLVFK